MAFNFNLPSGGLAGLQAYNEDGDDGYSAARAGMLSRQADENMTDYEQFVKVAQSNLDGPRFKLFRGESIETAAQFVDGGFDWVYIDADHHYENVKRDIEAWYPKVRAGGIVAGHDYVDYLDMGVIRAVNEFAAAHGYEVGLTTEDQPWNGVQFPTWWFQKRLDPDRFPVGNWV